MGGLDHLFNHFVSWQPILEAKSTKLVNIPSFIKLAFRNGFECQKLMGTLIAQMICLYRAEIWQDLVQ